eukprot:XP_001705251.1 VSP [Giardia lamblia ATCC 50803]
MCKTAEGGRCTAPSENGRYFLVPGASNTDQSVLACENPLGTVIGAGSTAKAYVGVYGCTACTAPAALEAPGMAPATCTACSANNKPNLAGSGSSHVPLLDAHTVIWTTSAPPAQRGARGRTQTAPSASPAVSTGVSGAARRTSAASAGTTTGWRVRRACPPSPAGAAEAASAQAP